MLNRKQIQQKSRYNPLEFEHKIFKFWESYFSRKRGQKNFTILIAPPNITGTLHLGHALQNIVLDTISRYQRMKGYRVTWFPGIDHAGIATQNVVEKQLKKEGLTRFDLGREKFIKRVWQWKEQYGNVILEQFKKLGLSLDWSKVKFTMDKKYVDAVEKAFIRYYQAGYIYRDLRPVNFCPRCQTSISDLEVDYQEKEADLYFIKYPLKENGYVEIATTRPETMLGDVALALNPKDENNFNFVGKIAILPLVGRELPIILDQRVDPKFGTGILKITPAHSLIDYEVGVRHQLPLFSVINEKAEIVNGGKFSGVHYLEARKMIVEELRKNGLLTKVQKINHYLPLCDRCGTELQVVPSKEWFLKMDHLAKITIASLRKKEVEFYPLRFKKICFDWLKNIRDWCISRKIWWGQQLPVWYCSNCGDDVFIVSQTKPKVKCKSCHKNNWQRTIEVFDTWFSSALWPFAILYTKEENKFYPADLVATGREILNLWISRMIFSGKYFKKEVPFRKVFVHPTVLTKEGKRMSKSLGTGIDPLDLIKKYGTDSLRFGILWQLSSHQDLRFDETPLIQGQKFLNKIWNAYRFYFLIKERQTSSKKNKILSSNDKKILSSLKRTKETIEKNIEKFELGLALKKVYKFFWNDVCDKYIESWKKDKNSLVVFDQIMIESLRMLHPFIPFLTQLIYFSFGQKKPLFFEQWK